MISNFEEKSWDIDIKNITVSHFQNIKCINLVDALAELHVVRVVVGGVVDGGVGGLECGLCAATVREGAPVVRDEGLRGVAPGKGLETRVETF